MAFIFGRILERYWLSLVSDVFVWIGSFWLAAMLYFFLTIVLLDIARIINHFFPFFSLLTKDYLKLKQIVALTTLSIVGITITLGYFNASYPRIKQLELDIAKTCSIRSLKIVMASDIHLGTIIGSKRFCKIVKKINTLEPDLVLLPGDIVDEDLGPVIKENLGEALKSIKSKYGIYAITGNHEYIGGVEAAYLYMSNHNVEVLRDSAVQVNNCLYLVGREDRSINQFAGKKRKSLAELLDKVDINKPIILMDHQPFQLNEASENKVDLQLSGHTHHGQLWPFNYITKAIYQLSWGYLKLGNTHFYVSSGAGTWGPPVRTGNHPEIVQIKLNFN